MRHRGIVFHALGLSVLSGAVFLQCLVFYDIVTQGYFAAVERDLSILTFEVVLTFFLVTYFVFVWVKFLRRVTR